MKKRKSFITNMILALLCASILIPAASLVVWVFTERWAWPDLFPQVLSNRAVMEIVRRKGELVSLMASSVMISSVVAVLSAVIGILTSRALVLYRFRGKDLMSFLPCFLSWYLGLCLPWGYRLRLSGWDLTIQWRGSFWHT